MTTGNSNQYDIVAHRGQPIFIFLYRSTSCFEMVWNPFSMTKAPVTIKIKGDQLTRSSKKHLMIIKKFLSLPN